MEGTLASPLTDLLIELELLRLREPAPPGVERFIAAATAALTERERVSRGGLRGQASQPSYFPRKNSGGIARVSRLRGLGVLEQEVGGALREPLDFSDDLA